MLNDRQIPLSKLSIRPEALAGLLGRVEEGRLSTTQAKAVFDRMAESGLSLDEAVSACGVTEGGVAGDALSAAIRGILEANADVVEEIRSRGDPKGKKVKFLQGLVMKETKGQARPPEVAAALDSALRDALK